MTWKVIAVDDQSFILQLISFALSDYEVHTFTSGTDVIHTLESMDKAGQLSTLVMVILDVMMPDMSGLELLPQIRQRYADLPVMMCSALSTVESVNQALALGATDYMVKPVNGTHLREKIARAVSRRRSSFVNHSHALHR